MPCSLAEEGVEFCFFEEDYYGDYCDGADDVVHYLIGSPAQGEMVYGEEADVQADMAEAHEDHGVLADVFQGGANRGEQARFIEPAEEIHPEQHGGAGIKVCEGNIAPDAVAEIRNVVADNKNIIYNRSRKEQHDTQEAGVDTLHKAVKEGNNRTPVIADIDINKHGNGAVKTHWQANGEQRRPEIAQQSQSADYKQTQRLFPDISNDQGKDHGCAEHHRQEVYRRLYREVPRRHIQHRTQRSDKISPAVHEHQKPENVIHEPQHVVREDHGTQLFVQRAAQRLAVIVKVPGHKEERVDADCRGILQKHQAYIRMKIVHQQDAHSAHTVEMAYSFFRFCRRCGCNIRHFFSSPL